jgi:DNA-binding response OmpR family regulator
LILPVMDRPKFIPPAETKTHEVSDASWNRKQTILLLEDEADYAETLKEYLESYDYSVTVVCDGVQGMKKVIEKDFDILICDLLMPNLPGDMFYRGVERVKPHLAKRFIFITGHRGDPRIADFLKKVRCLTLFKPFDLHVLLESLAVLGRRPKAAPGEEKSNADATTIYSQLGFPPHL